MFLDDTYHVFDLDKKAKGSALIEVRLVFFVRYIGNIEEDVLICTIHLQYSFMVDL